MFKNQITICVAKQYESNVAAAIFDIKICGGIDYFEEGGKAYHTIKTRMPLDKVSKEIERKFTKAKTEIHGNVIFVKIES